MDTPDLQPALERVQEYFAAFLSGDSEAYAAQWTYPACFFSQGRWLALSDAAACQASNDRYLAEARAGGMVSGRIQELSARPEGPRAAWVDGRFSREDAVGRTFGETRASYLVVQTAEGWRVAVCVVKD